MCHLPIRVVATAAVYFDPFSNHGFPPGLSLLTEVKVEIESCTERGGSLISTYVNPAKERAPMLLLSRVTSRDRRVSFVSRGV